LGLRASWETCGDEVWVRVRGGGLEQQQALRAVGFRRDGVDVVWTFPQSASHVESSVHNLEALIDEVVEEALGNTSGDWQSVLDAFLDRTDQAEVPAVVIGSAALASRGVAVRPAGRC
jgi:hypothetical protein